MGKMYPDVTPWMKISMFYIVYDILSGPKTETKKRTEISMKISMKIKVHVSLTVV